MSRPSGAERKAHLAALSGLLSAAWWFLAATALSPSAAANSVGELAPIKLGILAHRSAEAVQADWQPLLDELNRTLPQSAQMTLVSGDFREINRLIEIGAIDLILTNPAHLVRLRAEHPRMRALATIVEDRRGMLLSGYGGVIISAAERSDIQTLTDLPRARIAAVDADSLGGFQAQLYEMHRAGLPMPRPGSVLFTDMPHARVVDEVLSGRADVGFLRTSVLEMMAEAGAVDLADLRVINPQQHVGFPYRVSTALYPQWALAAMPEVSPELANLIAVTLLSMADTAPTAHNDIGVSFTVAVDYQPVEQLARALRLPPFDDTPDFRLVDVLSRYPFQSAAYAILLFFLVILLLALLLANRHLREMQQRFRVLFEYSPISIMLHDAETGEVLDANPAAWRAYGLNSLKEMRDFDLWMNSSYLGDQAMARLRRAASGVPQRFEWPGRRADGELFWEDVSLTPVTISGRKCVFSTALDITARKHHEDELDRVANYDTLTGLPNRRMLTDLLRQTIARAERDGHSFALCYLDLDEFKPINDEYGHSTGDKVLIEVGDRLRRVVRAGDSVARLGGDEFVVLLDEIQGEERIEVMLNRMLSSIRQPIHLDGLKLCVGASIGVTIYPNDAADADTLLRHADQAMYLAKDQGRNRYCLFDIDLERDAESRRRRLQRLREAIDLGELQLYYQPKVELESGRVLGVEALVRWVQPDGCVVFPDAFLDLIEHSELESRFSDMVLEQALLQLSTWNRAGLSLPVSINISGQSLLREGFVERIRRVLVRHPTVQPSDLELEIVETVAVADTTRAVAVLNECREMGLRIAMDDFGTGYSSLRYLRALPIDSLKIDQSFVRDMLVDMNDRGIVESVISLAIAFDLDVIAEGVESPAHAVELVKLGCRKGQGFAFSQAIPADQMQAWLEEWQLSRRWQHFTDDQEPVVSKQVE